MRFGHLHHGGQPCLAVLKGGLDDQRLSDPGSLQAEDALAFRKKFRALPIIAYDHDMSNLRVHSAVNFLSQILIIRTLPSTKVAAHLAKTPITSSFPPVL
jgi:hypothetical protein